MRARRNRNIALQNIQQAIHWRLQISCLSLKFFGSFVVSGILGRSVNAGLASYDQVIRGAPGSSSRSQFDVAGGMFSEPSLLRPEMDIRSV